MQVPASRNAPCPCGSGRRYKNCHGAISDSAPQANPVRQHLERALAAQRAGRYAEAAVAYEAALALQPENFDALHMLGVVHYQQGEFEVARDLLDHALAIDGSAPTARFNRALVQMGLDRRPVEAEIARAAEGFAATTAAAEAAITASDGAPVRVIAFYLPQFHRIPENDAWWGEGFTEWTNVRKARPIFEGHWQPHLPGELGYYDLTEPGVRRAQAVLAKAYGVDAFCYYHYWFGGRRLLERPLAEVLASGEPDFPFCLCWANENWTRRWDGHDDEVLIRQSYTSGDAHAFIGELLPAFRDRRYVRVNGRPLLLVYKIADIPNVAATVQIWRDACRAAGVGNPYLCAVQRNVDDDPTPFGFDAAVEFPPIGHAAENVTTRMLGMREPFRGMVFRYANLAAYYLMLPRPPFPQFRGVMPMWDNTARRQNDGMIVTGSTPASFGVWLAIALRQTRLRHDGDERLLFINAWNEWGEGNHIEPDEMHGRGYLEALRAARRVEAEPLHPRPALVTIERDLAAARGSGVLREMQFGRHCSRGRKHVAVVMPLYNHARYLGRALASLAAQSRLPDLLVVVDDGSTDDGAAIVEAFSPCAPFAVTLVQQANAGADRAINRGLMCADANIVAIINSDDEFAPTRLARLVMEMDRHQADFAFSATRFIDEGDAEIGRDHGYVESLRAAIAEGARARNPIYALLTTNIAISTGNFIFRRELLQRTGGFAAMKHCHDWDFILAASYHTPLVMVDEPLYCYRLHSTNTFSGQRLLGWLECLELLTGFFTGIAEHPILRDPTQAAGFIAHVRRIGMLDYLKASLDTRQ